LSATEVTASFDQQSPTVNISTGTAWSLARAPTQRRFDCSLRLTVYIRLRTQQKAKDR
jgi:hypothetical protein